jgi:serine/threonine protein kinase
VVQQHIKKFCCILIALTKFKGYKSMATYTELEKLGAGGFAEVFKVVDENAIEYAKKVFKPNQQLVEAVGEKDLKRRFSREVKYQSKVENINVVSIVEHSLETDPPYFIMPLAECTLQDQLENDPTLKGNPKEALFDILSGLEAVHDAGITHRDLKPANVLRFIDSDKNVHYAISDFGLISGGDSKSSTLTGSYARGGTENYAAPELMRDFKRATHYADIYSFGAILHDIFGYGQSRVPYTELSVPDADLCKIVARCTKTLPLRRYKSVRDLREDLFKVLDDKELVFTSDHEKDLVELLDVQDELSAEEWDKVFTQLDENSYKSISNANILRYIDDSHIEHLAESSPELIASLTTYFCDYIKAHSFDFDYCDVLATRALALYNHGELSSKAMLALAILELGVEHNRWYVEWRFVEMVSPKIKDELANRILVEVDATEFKFKHFITGLMKSISITEERFHPWLREALK